MRVMIVDDSSTTRSILKRMMKELNFETWEACNGQDGLNRIKEIGGCDLALIDWNMPEMNGLDLVKSLRSDISYEKTILIMVTTEIEITRVADALEAGANEYVMKPFTKDILKEKLELVGLL